MIEIKINISEEQILELLENKKQIKKSLPVEISFIQPPRKEALLKKVNKQKKQADYIFKPEHIKLISAWNDSKFITKVAGKEGRNSRIETNQSRSSIPLFTKAIKKIGLDNLLEAMEKYFAICERGRHIWGGTNHGFQNLRGFVDRMIKHEHDGDIPWWERNGEKPIEDDKPKQTLYIANIFSKTFLGRDNFGLKNPSPDYYNFLRCRKWIDQIHKTGKYSLSKGGLLGELLKCLKDGNRKPFVSAMMCSDRTWKILMPQWLSEKYG